MKRQEIITRKPRECEMSALGDIWHTVFGYAGAKSFFDNIYNVEHAIIAEHEGKPAAMGYIVPAGDFVCAEHTLPCAMLYGIATLPDYRGFGFGATVVNELIETAFNQGFEAVVLSPSEDSLYEYYAKITKLQAWFYVKEIALDFPISAQSHNKMYAVKITPEKYLEHREKLLKDIPHIKHTLATIGYQQKLCDELGGGLYKIGDACAIVEIQPQGAVWIKELLTLNDDVSDLIACITTLYEANEYIFRLPGEKEDIGINAGRRFGMLLLQEGISIDIGKSATLPWYGPAFD